ncbi:hypothetical protein KRP22_002132 [Phytophthora ramorum]|nr:Mannan polymerase complex subunit mnn9 [Phytophthora ramorum]
MHHGVKADGVRVCRPSIWRVGPLVGLGLLVLAVHSCVKLQLRVLKTPETLIPPPSSVLHPLAPIQAPLNPSVELSVRTTRGLFAESDGTFPQLGKTEPGLHYRVENNRLLDQVRRSAGDAVLLMVVFNDAESWGPGRDVTDFFNLIRAFDYPTGQISVSMLTSSVDEFRKIKSLFVQFIREYVQLTVIFRNDFAQEGLTRENRHAEALQNNRRRMLARYRNYALLATMQVWHQHVVWLDADIKIVPGDLMRRMIQSGRDIVEPMCIRMHHANSTPDDWYEYDLNAWVGERPTRRDGASAAGPSRVKHMWDLRGKKQEFMPLDSVGGTMLYVNADVHRQGVLFTIHNVIGSEWAEEGYDAIETEGLCYTAHFLGFKCWAMPQDLIVHA